MTGATIVNVHGDMCDADSVLRRRSATYRPEAVVHFAEQRAAPYSMIDRKHAVYTQTNNIVGTLNLMFAIGEIDRDIHVVKLGTMGEYGQPNIDIEEGWLDVEHKGRRDRMLFPKRPGCFYHLSKVHDTHNLEFGCRSGGCGSPISTRASSTARRPSRRCSIRDWRPGFDYDAVFGTVLNRFAIQAVLGRRCRCTAAAPRHGRSSTSETPCECVRLACENPADVG